jgi:hypothetical protein
MFLLKITFSTSNRLLFVAHMMGMYFLSAVLMMQLSLPTEYRQVTLFKYIMCYYDDDNNIPFY